MTVLLPLGFPMAKKKPTDGQQSDAGRAVSFRATPDLAVRLDAVAEGLGLDVSNLVRMVLNENLAEYEERVEQIRRRRQKGNSD